MVSEAGFQNNIVYSDQPDFSGSEVPRSTHTISFDNEIWLGRTAVVGGIGQIDVMTLTKGAGIEFTRAGAGVPGVPGSLTISLTGGGIAASSFAMQTGTSPVVPTAGGLVTFNGSSVVAGTHPVRTNGTGANTMQLEVQTSQAIAATDATKIGLCNFNNTEFTVDANGFVSLIGGGAALDSLGVQATSGGGTNPVLPDGTGKIEIQGAVVAAGTNPIRSVSTAANTLQIQAQTSQAIASTDATKIGMSNFDSASFGVDANGFVTFTGGINPASQTEIFDDFIFFDVDGSTGGGSFANYGIFCIKASGTGWTHTNDTNHPGIITNTNSAATDKYIASSNTTAFIGPQAGFGKFTFEWLAKIDFLSAANPNYQLAQGMWDNPSAVPEVGPIDGMYFLYNHAVNSGKYQLITRSGGVSTVTNTNSTVDTSWHRYKIVINAAGTSVSFYIDNVEVSGSPVVTNIPTTQMLYQYGIHATAGTNAKGFNIDYWYTKFEFTR